MDRIAAQVANAGVPVVLLDIVPSGANNRNALAEGAVAKMRKAEPAAGVRGARTTDNDQRFFTTEGTEGTETAGEAGIR